jgi:hypothetical protein
MLLNDRGAVSPSVDLDDMKFRQEEPADGAEFAGQPGVAIDHGRICGATMVPIAAFAEVPGLPIRKMSQADYDAMLAEHRTAAAALTASVRRTWSLPVAAPDTAWNPTQAQHRILTWSGGDMTRYAQAFLWSDQARFLFPLADVIDGQLALIPAALREAGQVLARGLSALPEKDQMAMADVITTLQAGDGDEETQLSHLLAGMSALDLASISELAEDLAADIEGSTTFGARFDKLVTELTAKGKAADPKALAAWIGRRKYGAAGMVRLAKGAAESAVKPLGRNGKGSMSLYPEDVRGLVAASGDRFAPARTVFEVPEAAALTPLTVTPDRRVFGHISDWKTCHTGFAGSCKTSPRSRTQYAYFHLGSVHTAEGEDLPVGKITVGGGHADPLLGVRPTLAHYDDVSTTAALVRATDGKFGVWVSGILHPSLDDLNEFDLRTSPPSGDWRMVGGNLELVGVHSVNQPGFPIARGAVGHLVASAAGDDEVVSLIAPPVLGDAQASGLAVSPDQVREIARETAAQTVAEFAAAQRRARQATAALGGMLDNDADDAPVATQRKGKARQALAAMTGGK